MVLKKVSKEVISVQSRKKCIITGCDGYGRTIGRLGDIDLNYCGHHRKYGERVLNFFAASIFNQELMEFLRETKQDLFWNNKPELCEHCYKKIQSYTDDKIVELDGIKQWEPRKKLSKASKK